MGTLCLCLHLQQTNKNNNNIIKQLNNYLKYETTLKSITFVLNDFDKFGFSLNLSFFILLLTSL